MAQKINQKAFEILHYAVANALVLSRHRVANKPGEAIKILSDEKRKGLQNLKSSDIGEDKIRNDWLYIEEHEIKKKLSKELMEFDKKIVK